MPHRREDNTLVCWSILSRHHLTWDLFPPVPHPMQRLLTLEGMGLTSALQDVVALAKYIDGPETDFARALDRYEQERRIPATMLQLISRMTMVVIKYIVCA